MNSKLSVSGDVSFNANFYALGRTILQGDVSMNSRLFINCDVSLNSRLFVNSDVSMNARLFVSDDVSLNANLYALGRTIQQGDVSMNSRLFINGDVSMNSRLFISSDVSMNARLFVSDDVSFNANLYSLGRTIQQGDVSMNSRLFINGDVSMNSRLFVSSDVSMNARLFVFGDVSLNSGLYTAEKIVIGGDASINSRLFVGSDITLGGRIFVGDSLFKSGNDFSNDLSSNARLFVSGDVSMGSRLFIKGDVSLNSRLFVSNDVSINSNLFVGKDLIITGRLNVQEYTQSSIIYTNVTTTDYTLVIAEDISLNGRLNVNYDVSLNSRLFVSGDVSFNSKFYVKGKVVLNSDVSMNSNLSLTGNATVGGNIILPANANVLVGGVALGSTTSTTTNDTWTLTNFVSAPPAIIIGTIVYTSTSICIPWTYPTQINIGFSTYPVPYLMSLSCQYTYNNGSSNQTGYALQNATGTAYASTYASNSDGKSITAIILTKNSSATVGYGLTSLTTPTRYAYTFYNAGFSSLIDAGSNSVSIWYSNNSLSTTSSLSTSVFSSFVSSGYPGVVLNLTISSTNVSNNINISFSYTQPTLYDVTNNIATSGSTPISAYKITYSSIASSIRYGTAASDAGTTFSQAGTSYTLTSSYPDTTYTYTVSARNALNTNYGTTASTTVTTTYLNPLKASFDSISFATSPYNSTTTAKMVSNATSYSNVYLGTTAQDWTSNSFGSPINSTTYRGSSTSAALTVNAVLGSNVVTATYTGFPATNPGNVSSAGLSIITTTPYDSYSTGYGTAYQGFYLQTGNQVKIPAATLIASSTQYSLTVTQTQAGGSTASSNFSFYFDTYANPTVSSFTTSIYPNTTTSLQVCGIWITYGTARLNSTTAATSIGNYFYNNSQILAYAGTSTTYENNLNNVTSGKSSTQLSGTVTITNSAGGINYSTGSYSTTIPSITVTAYNQVGTTATNTSSSIPVIFDQPTYTLYSSLKTTIGAASLNTSASYGLRVYSGTPLSGTNVPNFLNGGTVAYSTLSFSNAWDLTNSNNSGSDGTQELLMANGAFRTSDSTYAKQYSSFNYSTGSAIAQNTVNYTSIASETGYRYMTFAWKVATNLSGSNTKINISLTSNLSVVNSLLYADAGGSNKVLVYYRIEDTAALSSFSSNNASTYWVSVNDNASGANNSGPVSGSNYYTVPSNNKPYYSSPTTTTSLITAGLPLALSTSTTGLTSGNIYVYVRIGLPMNVSTSYISAIQAYLSA